MAVSSGGEGKGPEYWTASLLVCEQAFLASEPCSRRLQDYSFLLPLAPEDILPPAVEALEPHHTPHPQHHPRSQ